MKPYAKILGVLLVLLAIQFTLGGGETGEPDVFVSRAVTVTSNTTSVVSRAFTVTSNTNSIVSRAFTVTSNTNSIVSRAFTAVNWEEVAGGLCLDCNDNELPDQCELDCGHDGGPCDLAGCGQSVDCNENSIPDDCDTIGNGDFDGDGTVDLDDHSAFADCMAGADQEPQPSSPDCVNACLGAFDFDGDNDVDLIDFALFQALFTG